MTPDMKELPAELGALALRCEQATGPDWELDCAIKEIIGDSWDYAADWGPRDNCNPVAKVYTASLDAAMTLVPEDWHTEMVLQDRHSMRWKWALRGGFGVRSEAWADTAALALCAAALRARFHLNHSGTGKGEGA